MAQDDHERTVTLVTKIIESACIGSNPKKECEDILVVETKQGKTTFVAVVDGATDKTGQLYDGHTSGRLAAETLAATIGQLDEDVDPYVAVALMTRNAEALRKELGISDVTTMAPSASFALLSVHRRELWRVGDCHMALRAQQHYAPYPGEKAVDIATSLARSAYTACLLAGGGDPADISRDDPGRRFIMPLLEAQGVLSNSMEPSLFAYGVIDGTPVPSRLVEVLPLPDTACEVILATDGYIKPERTLEEAEKTLSDSIRLDPLRIGAHRGTKGLRPGAHSFDDRAWVRVKLSAATGDHTGTTKTIRKLFWQD